MTPLSIQVVDRHLLPGISAGLSEKTAFVELAVDGGIAPGAFDRIRAGATTLCPDQPLFGVRESDWPAAFLVQPGQETPEWQIGNWVVAITIAFQRWGGAPVWRGQVVGVDQRRIVLALPWFRERLLGDAVGLAVRLVEQWSRAVPDRDELQRLLRGLDDGLVSAQAHGFWPATMRFIQAAVERGIPFEVLRNCIQLGWGAESERMDASVTGRTSLIGTLLADDPAKARRALAGAGLRLPRGGSVTDIASARQTAAGLGWPVVVKPGNSHRDVAPVLGIRDDAALVRAFDAAVRVSPGGVIVEQHLAGGDYRLLVVDGRVLAAARRVPGGVLGDGAHTVEQLVERVNSDPRRGDSPRSLLRRLKFDVEALDCLAEQNVPVGSVPAAGRWVGLRRRATVGTGGSAVDVTADVHPDNRALVERAARVVGIDIVGIDFITTDISRSWREIGGAIRGVEPRPDFQPHWIADPGRDIHGEIVSARFAGRTGRIPTAAITGTNGKTTTASMLHHIWMTAGAFAGLATSPAVLAGREVVTTKHLAGLPGGWLQLRDPGIEAAIIEMPRKGLIYLGHPCDRYDVAGLVNVQDDHIGVDGVNTLEQMAVLKAQVLERAVGAVVINADDPLCMVVRGRAGTDRHVLVARDGGTVAGHRGGGGEAVFLEDRDGRPWIVLAAGPRVTPLMPLHDIPATLGGVVRVNESNAMFAAAMAWAQGIEPDTIRAALATFRGSADQNPGRYNFFDGLPFQVMLDFGHNPEGVREVCAVARAIPVTGRRIILTQRIGARHAAHYVEVGPDIAGAFDEVVVSCDPTRVFPNPEYAGDDPVAIMLARSRQAIIDGGAHPDRVRTEADVTTAIRQLLTAAQPGDLLVLLAHPHQAIPIIDEFVEREAAR